MKMPDLCTLNRSTRYVCLTMHIRSRRIRIVFCLILNT